jgi:hypothetical protein
MILDNYLSYDIKVSGLWIYFRTSDCYKMIPFIKSHLLEKNTHFSLEYYGKTFSSWKQKMFHTNEKIGAIQTQSSQ